MKEYLELKSKKALIGYILGIASFFLCYASVHEFKQGAVFGTIFILLGILNVPNILKKTKLDKYVWILWPIVCSFLTISICQLALNETFVRLLWLKLFLNMLIYLFLYCILFALTSRPRICTTLISVVMILFSTINFYVFLFRGSEVAPADILSIQTAGNVAAQYTITLMPTILYAWMFTGILLFMNWSMPAYQRKEKSKKTRLMHLAAAAAIAVVFAFGSTFITTYKWLQTGSLRNGYILNFTLQLKEDVFVQKPDGYSPKNVEETARQYKAAEESTGEERTPDVIVIMDESFADFRVLGDNFNPSEDIMPFIDSMSENVIKGYALSSVFGGGTPNSEYEFLSGNSLLFLPHGSVVYQQYLKNETYSVVSDLHNRGYKTIAMHPYFSNSWMRTTVYPLLGFDDAMFLDDFPQEDIMRKYVSDQEMFDTMIRRYEEEKKQGNKVFMFGITMQNHGGYTYVGDNYETTIMLNGYKQEYSDVEQYLTCIHATDAAVEKLISYFSGVDHDVVVVFYGDHYPKLDGSFYEAVHGGSFETFDEQQEQFTVPFFIWANYDIEEENVSLTSFNYLSNYMYKAAGMELPLYNRYLEDVRKAVPAMNSNGYYSVSQGGFVRWKDAAGEEYSILNRYYQLLYNSLFDSKNRNQDMFPDLDQ